MLFAALHPPLIDTKPRACVLLVSQQIDLLCTALRPSWFTFASDGSPPFINEISQSQSDALFPKLAAIQKAYIEALIKAAQSRANTDQAQDSLKLTRSLYFAWCQFRQGLAFTAPLVKSRVEFIAFKRLEHLGFDLFLLHCSSEAPQQPEMSLPMAYDLGIPMATQWMNKALSAWADFSSFTRLRKVKGGKSVAVSKPAGRLPQKKAKRQPAKILSQPAPMDLDVEVPQVENEHDSEDLDMPQFLKAVKVKPSIIASSAVQPSPSRLSAGTLPLASPLKGQFLLVLSELGEAMINLGPAFTDSQCKTFVDRFFDEFKDIQADLEALIRLPGDPKNITQGKAAIECLIEVISVNSSSACSRLQRYYRSAGLT